MGVPRCANNATIDKDLTANGNVILNNTAGSTTTIKGATTVKGATTLENGLTVWDGLNQVKVAEFKTAQINLHSPLIAMNTAKFKKLATFEQGARISNAGLTIDNGGLIVNAGLSYLKGGLNVSGNSGNGYALNVSGSGKVTGSLTASTLDISSASLTSINTAGGIQAANTIRSTGGDVVSGNGSRLNAFERCHFLNGEVKVTDPKCANQNTDDNPSTLTLTCSPSTCSNGDFNTGNYAQAQVSVFASYSCQGTCSVSWSTDGSLGSGTGTQTQKTWTLTSTSCGWRTKNGNVTVTVTDNATGLSKTVSRFVSMEVETGGC